MAHSHPDPLKLTHQCEVLGQMLIRAQHWDDDMQTCACLKLVLEQLKRTLTPLGIPAPQNTGARNIQEELRTTLNRLQEKLDRNDPREFTSLWNMCCEALGLVNEFLYQQERGLFAGQVVEGDDLG